MTASVKSLAREIDAAFNPMDEKPAFFERWHKKLIETIRDNLGVTDTDHIFDMCERMLAADDLRRAAMDCRYMLDRRDQEDGWCTDIHDSALEAVCVSIECTERPGATRWPAESGSHVWRYVTGAKIRNDVSRYSRDSWLRKIYYECTK